MLRHGLKSARNHLVFSVSDEVVARRINAWTCNFSVNAYVNASRQYKLMGNLHVHQAARSFAARADDTASRRACKWTGAGKRIIAVT